MPKNENFFKLDIFNQFIHSIINQNKHSNYHNIIFHFPLYIATSKAKSAKKMKTVFKLDIFNQFIHSIINQNKHSNYHNIIFHFLLSIWQLQRQKVPKNEIFLYLILCINKSKVILMLFFY